jgi:hypothetical protein
MSYFNAPHFRKFKIPVHSDAWFEFRTVGNEDYEGGFGASEVAKFIGFNDYAPVAPEVFYHKIGISEPRRFMNEKIYWGLTNEDRILEAWKFQDASEEGSYAENHSKYKETGNEVHVKRNNVSIPYYLVNDKFPWLFASLDSGIAEGSPMIDPEGHWAVDEETGEVLVTRGICPLECKNMGSYSLKQWEGGMNPTYLAQVHAQMIVTETYYSEIVVLEDGWNLKIFPVYLQPDVAGEILENTKQVWHNVLECRKVWADYGFANAKQKEEIWAYIQSKEPEVSAGKAYRDWLKEQIKNPGAQLNMSDKHLDAAVRYRRFADLEKTMKTEKEKSYNWLMNQMRLMNAGKLSLGKTRAIGYSPDSGRLSVRGFKKVTSKESSIMLKRLGI